MRQEKKEEEESPAFKDSVNAAIREFKDFIKKSQEGQITATRNKTDHIRVNRKTITPEKKWEEKQPSGYFKRQTAEISREKTWALLKIEVPVMQWLSS